MGYVGTTLRDDVTIDELFTLHYFEYTKGFSFKGESHDFWEMVYVDKGEVIVTAGEREMTLSHGDAFFHHPNQWHNVRSRNAANTVILSFRCSSPVMDWFYDRRLKAGNLQKKLISKILTEGVRCFEGPFGDPYSERLIRKRWAPVGAEQLIRQYLSELLILFMREESDTAQMSSFKSHISDTTFDEIEAYMQKNIGRHLTLADIASYANISISSLREIFRNNASCGVIDYFIFMKIDRAKWYIREGNYNITQIAELLGYSSPHYFSRQFREKTGMSPLQYAKSVQSLVVGDLTKLH